MKIFAISDLHLSVNNPKPMDIFGPTWEGYVDKIFSDWKAKVSEDDLVLMAGDFSWAMRLEETKSDFDMLKSLPGKKVIIRGNHDYWWKSISAVRNILPVGFYAIQNDAIKFDDYIICGTRLWNLPDVGKVMTEENEKIYKRELIRLELTLQTAVKLKTGDEKIVCMLHYPPYTFKEEDNEVTALLEKYGVHKVVYGHIHAYCKQNLVLNKHGIDYFLTSCDLVGNKLIEIC
ncbi:MAG: metallophosphoesterase [Clostridia bacterium]|nr:metallophosphoesterase [Clostridia bacterium]